MDQRTDAFIKTLDKFYEKGDSRGAEEFLTRTLASIKSGEYDDFYLTVVKELGNFYVNTQKFSDAVRLFLHADGVIRKNYGTQTAAYASNLNNIAGAYRMAGDEKKALSFLLKALKIFEGEVGKENLSYASALDNLSQLYQGVKEFDYAEACLEEMLDVYKKIGCSVDKLCVVYNRLAKISQERGDNTTAGEYLKKSLKILEPYADKIPRYSVALDNLAGFYFNVGDYKEAERAYVKTIAWIEKHHGKGKEYGLACQNLAAVYEKQGMPEEALECMEEALPYIRRAFGKRNQVTRALEAGIKEYGRLLNEG